MIYLTFLIGDTFEYIRDRMVGSSSGIIKLDTTVNFIFMSIIIHQI